MGGSIPTYLFQQPNDTPVIGLLIENHDKNQHAADENLRLQNLWDGIEIYAALFAGWVRNVSRIFRWRRFAGDRRSEPAALQQRRGVGFAAGEILKKLHGVLAAAAKKKRVAEVVAVFTFEAAVFLEPLDTVGIEHLAPEVAVITGRVTAGEKCEVGVR